MATIREADLTCEHCVLTPVVDLYEGMLIDLEKDPYADPDGDNIDYECEYQMVVSVSIVNTVGVELDSGDIIGFPLDHEVRVHTEEGMPVPIGTVIAGLQEIVEDLR